MITILNDGNNFLIMLVLEFHNSSKAPQGFSRIYSSISMAWLFQHPLYYQQQGVLPVILAFNLNVSESAMLALGSFSWYCHKSSVFAWLLLYSIRLYKGITISNPMHHLLRYYILDWCIFWMLHNFWMTFVCISCYHICSHSTSHYIPFHKYVPITIVTKTWPK